MFRTGCGLLHDLGGNAIGRLSSLFCINKCFKI